MFKIKIHLMLLSIIWILDLVACQGSLEKINENCFLALSDNENEEARRYFHDAYRMTYSSLTYMILNYSGCHENKEPAMSFEEAIKVISDNKIGDAQAYIRNEFRFKSFNLTYMILFYPDGLEEAEVDTAFEKAIKEWTKYIPVRITKVTSEGANIKIKFVYDRFDTTTLENEHNLIHIDLPTETSDSSYIFFNADANWTTKSTSEPGKFNLTKFALRVIGSALGVASVDDANSIMSNNFMQNDAKELSKIDVRAMQSFYGTSECPIAKLDKVPPICVEDESVIFASLNGSVFAFKEVEEGYPKPIREVFPGLPSKITTAFEMERGVYYFFRFRKYWIMNNGKVTGPKSIEEKFPNFSADEIVHAALKLPDDNETYLFSMHDFYIISSNFSVYTNFVGYPVKSTIVHNDRIFFIWKNQFWTLSVKEFQELVAQLLVNKGEKTSFLDIISRPSYNRNAILFRCYSTPAIGTTGINVVEPQKHVNKTDVCSYPEFDAFVTIKGDPYIFRYDQVFKLVDNTPASNKNYMMNIMEGYPKKIKVEFPCLPNNIESAYAPNVSVTLVFQGKHFWSIDGDQVQVCRKFLIADYFMNIAHVLSVFYLSEVGQTTKNLYFMTKDKAVYNSYSGKRTSNVHVWFSDAIAQYRDQTLYIENKRYFFYDEYTGDSNWPLGSSNVISFVFYGCNIY